MKKKILRLFLYTIFLCLASGSLFSASYVGYTVIATNTNISRGVSRAHHFSFGLCLQGADYSEVELKTISFRIINPGAFPLTIYSSIYLHSTNSGSETLLSMSLPNAAGDLHFLINETVTLRRGITNIIHLSADLQNFSGDDTPGNLTFSMQDNFIQVTPSANLTLSNLNEPAGTFPNLHPNLIIRDKHIVFTDKTNLITSPPATTERGNSYLIQAFTLSNKYYTLTKAPILIRGFSFTSIASNTKKINIYQDNGDTTFDAASDALLTSAELSTNIQWVNIPSGVYLPDANPVLLWVTAQVDQNAWITPSPAFFLKISSNMQASGGFMGASSFSFAGTDPFITSIITPISDTQPPALVNNVSSEVGNNSVLLRWTNPNDSDLYRIRILYKAGVTPASFTDGSFVDIDVRNAQGQDVNHLIPALANGTPYHFLIYSYDIATNFATPVGSGGTLVLTPTPTTNTPSRPAGIQIVPYNNRYELNWQASTDTGFHYYIIQCYNNFTPSIYSFTNYTPSYTIYLTNLGYGSTMSQHTGYFAITSVNLDGTKSDNYAATWTELLSKGKKISYSHVAQNNGAVYNNFFRPDFGEFARIIVNMQSRGNVKIKIYNIAGELTKTIANRTMESGSHEFKWYGKSTSGSVVNPGLYLVHMRFNDVNVVKKIVVRR